MAAGLSETGAQLFARLGSKPSLETLDPRLFPPPDCLRPSHAVEFYGPIGCGKTEMLLHIISRCILPGCWRGAVLGGMGVGVVLVDADFQFSMLRLFQILERRVADVMERMKNEDQNSKAATKSEKGSLQSSTGMDKKVKCGAQEKPKICRMCNNNDTIKDKTPDFDQQSVNACLCSQGNANEITASLGKKRTRTGNVKHDDGAPYSATKKLPGCKDTTQSNQTFEMPSADDVEAFIKSCLNRFYLVRSGGSSDQLIMDLHSLESLVANRPDVSILMLENIAAFYWTDKGNSGGVASAAEANQRRAVDIIKRLIEEYRLVFMATKPALIQRGHRTKGFDDSLPATPSHTNLSHSDSNKYSHHEFMCNAWNKLITHRYVMRRMDPVNQNRAVSLPGNYSAFRTLPSSDQPCRFSITERGLTHH
ncbi:DNA repair protein XRCC2-like [Asterias rubens]|uniref:DNA repair protein XRCC2-like n=1 Tax=Asterias rubens TaxID=7604 RepID=UPI0014554117|nr:DNA repair protein XRCC2-like [Asterias rubens]